MAGTAGTPRSERRWGRQRTSWQRGDRELRRACPLTRRDRFRAGVARSTPPVLEASQREEIVRRVQTVSWSPTWQLKPRSRHHLRLRPARPDPKFGKLREHRVIRAYSPRTEVAGYSSSTERV